MAGYVVEKSLSIDNIFVFSVIFQSLSIPLKYQHRVLFWGIFGALIMRAGLIFAGASILTAFHWVIYIFGGFLAVTGIKMLIAANSEPDIEGNIVVRAFKKMFRVTSDFEGNSFIVRREGKLLQLNPTALKILQALMEASPAVVTRQELETRVWGEELPDSDSLRVHIHGLRAVVDKPFPVPYIQTRHGIGYRIAAPDGGG